MKTRIEQCGANVDGWTCRKVAGHDGPCLFSGGRVIPGLKPVEVVDADAYQGEIERWTLRLHRSKHGKVWATVAAQADLPDSLDGAEIVVVSLDAALTGR